MTDKAVKRPPILAGACLYLGMLATIMAVRAVSVVSTWNGDDRASDFDGTLTVLRDAGLSASGAESAYKIFLTVIAVLAAAGAVFAVYTARGDRASRVGMTVAIGVAGFMTFTGLLGGSFFFAMVGALAVAFLIRLWTGEVRTYFRTLAGHVPAEPARVGAPVDPFADPYRHPASSGAGRQTAVQEPVTQEPVTQEPVTQEPVTPPSAPAHGAQQEYQQAYGQPYEQPWPAQRPAGREPLPKPVSIAVWTALIGSIAAAGVSAMMLLAVVVLGVDYDTVIAQGGPGADMMRDSSESDFDAALRYLVVISSIAVVLGIGGLLAAIRVLVTRRSGDVLLFVMTVVTLIVSVIAFPLGIPWTAAAIVALVQLRRPEAKRWFVKT